MNIIYMGTPDFAVPALEKLAKSNHTVQAVFTQPDKPRGRKMIMTPPDVKVCAENLGITVYQPQSMRTEESLEIIKKYSGVRTELQPIPSVSAYPSVIGTPAIETTVGGATVFITDIERFEKL